MASFVIEPSAADELETLCSENTCCEKETICSSFDVVNRRIGRLLDLFFVLAKAKQLQINNVGLSEISKWL